VASLIASSFFGFLHVKSRYVLSSSHLKMFNRHFGGNNILCMQSKYTDLSSGLDFGVGSGYMESRGKLC